MISIQYGGWTPDLANVAFQMPDQQGPVVVPVADCLNVYFANGTYQSLPTASAVSGSPILAGQCVGAFTYLDTNDNPFPLTGVSNGSLYYWQSSAWNLLQTTTTGLTGCNFCQFGTQIFTQQLVSQAFTLVTGNLAPATIGGVTTPSYITGAPYATVLGVVGQFVMVGDICGSNDYIAITPASLGVGPYAISLMSPPGSSQAIYPTSVNISIVGGTGGGTGTDNGQGVITGTGIASGTINYDTGLVTVTFTNPPSGGANIRTVGYPAYRARLAWSPIGNANPSGGWPTPLTNAALAVQSGIQDLEYDYGPIMGISGYPLYGVIFQANAITRASYIGGNVVFSWQTFSRNLGLVAKGAFVQVGANTYFLSDQGFFYTDGANVVPIGTAGDNSAGIDGWFWTNVNKSALPAIRAAYDGRRRCVMFAVPTGSNTLPDTLLTYNVLAGRWTRAAQSTELIWSDTDNTTNRVGVFNQSHAYCLLTGSPSTGYLESCDLAFSDGNTRFTPQVRPNINCSDTPTAIVGVRNNLESSITYSAAGTPDTFSAGFAPTLNQKGLYTRVRISSAAATAINGATAKMRQGGPL